MRLMLLFYDEVFDHEVMEALDRRGRLGFSKWERVQGRGARAEPRMGTGVWPGYNCALMVAMDAELCQGLVDDLARLKQSGEISGVSIFALPVEQLL